MLESPCMILLLLVVLATSTALLCLVNPAFISSNCLFSIKDLLYRLISTCIFKFILNKICLVADLNYEEDSAGGPDVTVGILPTLDKVTLLQVCDLNFCFSRLFLASLFVCACDHENGDCSSRSWEL